MSSKVTNSLVTEAVALLWLISGYTVGGWFKWVGIVMFIENIVESIIESYLEHKVATQQPTNKEELKYE